MPGQGPGGFIRQTNAAGFNSHPVRSYWHGQRVIDLCLIIAALNGESVAHISLDGEILFTSMNYKSPFYTCSRDTLGQNFWTLFADKLELKTFRTIAEVVCVTDHALTCTYSLGDKETNFPRKARIAKIDSNSIFIYAKPVVEGPEQEAA